MDIIVVRHDTSDLAAGRADDGMEGIIRGTPFCKDIIFEADVPRPHKKFFFRIE
ncbi:MAG: hypothetical protein HQL36_06265 [Alphaproteobacteria bacterium]|nr:hypothetical protein [Alphaproteobacteria bacterium]